MPLKEDVYNCFVVLFDCNILTGWITSFLWSWVHLSSTVLFWRGRWHTLVSVSWVVPATASDKLHVATKWRLLALIERLSLSAAGRAHLYSVSATHDQHVQMKLSCSSATTDVVWKEHRKRKMSSLYKKGNRITILFFSLTPLFFFPLSEISITLFINIMSRCHTSAPMVSINLMVSSHDVCLRFFDIFSFVFHLHN